jgi:hypothetical protein
MAAARKAHMTKLAEEVAQLLLVEPVRQVANINDRGWALVLRTLRLGLVVGERDEVLITLVGRHDHRISERSSPAHKDRREACGLRCEKSACGASFDKSLTCRETLGPPGTVLEEGCLVSLRMEVTKVTGLIEAWARCDEVEFFAFAKLAAEH